MKISGLRNKKPEMARAAWRSKRVWMHVWWSPLSKLDAICRWHRAAKGTRPGAER